MMQAEQVVKEVTMVGVTSEDIRRIFERTFEEHAKKGYIVKTLYLDVGYLYTFDPSDVWMVKKLSNYIRENPKYAIEWHRMLERWFQDQTVIDGFGRPFKPIAISFGYDKLPNEALEALSASWCGDDTLASAFKYGALGDGDTDQAYASDFELVNELERIDVTKTSGGGSIGRDGSVIYAVQNHDIDCPGDNTALTETGWFDKSTSDNDKMGEHSIFPIPVPHNQGDDAPGSTSVIYPCSA